jgi:hypothetical protein
MTRGTAAPMPRRVLIWRTLQYKPKWRCLTTQSWMNLAAEIGHGQNIREQVVKCQRARQADEAAEGELDLPRYSDDDC